MNVGVNTLEGPIAFVDELCSRRFEVRERDSNNHIRGDTEAQSVGRASLYFIIMGHLGTTSQLAPGEMQETIFR